MEEEDGPQDTLMQHEESQEITGAIPSSRKRGGNLSQGRAKKDHLPPLESKPTAEDILHALLPPRHYVEGEKKFVQYVSTTLASRSDVTKLKEALDVKLEER
jgi:dynein light intermediate chain